MGKLRKKTKKQIAEEETIRKIAEKILAKYANTFRKLAYE